MKELENNHLVIIIIITDSGKNHQWMIKLVDKNLKSSNSLGVSPPG